MYGVVNYFSHLNGVHKVHTIRTNMFIHKELMDLRAAAPFVE